MARIERPRCDNPQCYTKRMHTATIRFGTGGSGGTVIIGFYCRDCGAFRPVSECE